MPALITSAIPSANFELVRDKIAEILTLELANQYALTGDPDINAAIYKERSIDVDLSEAPAINVCFSTGNYDNKDSRQVDGTYFYNIDFYANAATEDSDRGDELAMAKTQRLMAIVRYILEHPSYRTLGFARPSLSHTSVQSLGIVEPQDNNDATHPAFGRIVYKVRVPETVSLSAATNIGTSLTEATLYETDKGYRYVWSTKASFYVDANGTSFTLPTAYSGYEVMIVGLDNQAYPTGFTQAGDTITMTNGASFYTGQLITAVLKLRDYTTRVTVADAGKTFTLPAAYEGKSIKLIFDGTQVITSADFTQDGLNITVTNDTVFYAGQVVLVWYGIDLVTITAEAGNSFTLPDAYADFETVMVCAVGQPYSRGFTQTGLTTTMTNEVTFTAGQILIIAVR